MDVNYWNEFADEYDEHVIDAFTYGRSKMIGQQVKRFASPEKDVADFGCGPGKMLPYLSEKFRTVYGYDFSDKLLEVCAQTLCGSEERPHRAGGSIPAGGSPADGGCDRLAQRRADA